MASLFPCKRPSWLFCLMTAGTWVFFFIFVWFVILFCILLSADFYLIFFDFVAEPTQIYRYLRTRNMIAVSRFECFLQKIKQKFSKFIIQYTYTQPIFLYRNLSYMKERIKRTNKSRSEFKVDSLQRKLEEKKNGSTNDKTLGEYMTLMFLGFFDKTLPDEEAEVETFVSKISHKKRKDSFKTLQERVSVCHVRMGVNVNHISDRL